MKHFLIRQWNNPEKITSSKDRCQSFLGSDFHHPHVLHFPLPESDSKHLWSHHHSKCSDMHWKTKRILHHLVSLCTEHTSICSGTYFLYVIILVSWLVGMDFFPVGSLFPIHPYSSHRQIGGFYLGPNNSYDNPVLFARLENFKALQFSISESLRVLHFKILVGNSGNKNHQFEQAFKGFDN